MKHGISFAMTAIGVGLLVLGVSVYVPAGSGEFAGWSPSCQWCMTIGSMLAVAGLRLPQRQNAGNERLFSGSLGGRAATVAQ
jgi:hypothetical protein